MSEDKLAKLAMDLGYGITLVVLVWNALNELQSRRLRRKFGPDVDLYRPD